MDGGGALAPAAAACGSAVPPAATHAVQCRAAASRITSCRRPSSIASYSNAYNEHLSPQSQLFLSKEHQVQVLTFYAYALSLQVDLFDP
jgi:hypothetical protein